MSEWTKKSNHGLHWGWYRRRDTAKDWRIHLDNYEVCHDIGSEDPQRHLLKFGNEWGHRPFQHPNNLSHQNWHFWDNPEIPQLLWPNPANPMGSKDWIRWVPGEILTTKKTENGASRINDLLKHYSNGRVTAWHDIAPVKPVSFTPSKTMLLVPSSPANYEHYYGTNQARWIEQYSKELRRLGYEVEIRIKRGRKFRKQGNELTDQLNTGKYFGTVSQHSVAAMETIMAGYPAIVTGPHPAGNLATPWQEFADGHTRKPTLIDTINWVETLLGNCRHKSEIFGGTWHV